MSKLKDKLAEGKEFIVTCEFVPGRGPKGKSIDAAVEFGKKVVSSGLPVHAISITDNPGGNPAISPDVLAMELNRIGIEGLVHFACSDGNRNILESRAYALARDGVHNLLVVTGDYQTSGFEGMAKPVFDVDSAQMVRYLHEMNEGLEIPGRKKGTTDRLPKTDFCIGCVVSPFKKHEAELMTQFFKLEKKATAGAHFIIPQLGYDVRKFAEVLKYMRLRGINLPILGNVYVINKMVAGAMNKGLIPGCVVTDELKRKIDEEAKSDDKGNKAKLERAAQLMAIFRGMKFNGVHIGGFGLKFEEYEHIIRRSEEIGENWREFIPNFRYGQKGEFYLFPDDPELTFDEDKLKPAALSKPWVPFMYRFSRMFHWLFFKDGGLGFKMARGFYSLFRNWRRFNKFLHFFERIPKSVLFNCQDCGDCALFDLAYLCPMSKCAKFQRNGPCGGSMDGMCEADNLKPCVWTLVYKRLASVGGLDSLRAGLVPPADGKLSKTSSWANYYLGKDHTSKRIAAEKAGSKPVPAQKPKAEAKPKAEPKAKADSTKEQGKPKEEGKAEGGTEETSKQAVSKGEPVATPAAPPGTEPRPVGPAPVSPKQIPSTSVSRPQEPAKPAPSMPVSRPQEPPKAAPATKPVTPSPAAPVVKPTPPPASATPVAKPAVAPRPTSAAPGPKRPEPPKQESGPSLRKPPEVPRMVAPPPADKPAEKPKGNLDSDLLRLMRERTAAVKASEKEASGKAGEAGKPLGGLAEEARAALGRAETSKGEPSGAAKPEKKAKAKTKAKPEAKTKAKAEAKTRAKKKKSKPKAAGKSKKTKAKGGSKRTKKS